MAKRTKATDETVAARTTETPGTAEPAVRRCTGSKRFGIEAHEAPIGDFPRQPSQKDGLGRMCAVHWRQYTAGLARDAKARKAGEAPAEPEIVVADASPEEVPAAAKRRRIASTAQGNRYAETTESVDVPGANSEGDAA